MTISIAALNLLKQFEGCSLHPEWPGFSSGVTLGYGVDIGADPAGLEAWKPYVSAADFARLEKAKGITGEAAKPVAASLKDIAIKESDAAAIFATVTLPRYVDVTLKAFPSADALPDDSFGALVSLVFNRGGSTSGAKRGEMGVIKTDVAAGSTQWWDIVVQLAKMVVYWNDGVPTASNLPGRRLAEAALFARGLRTAGLAEASTLLLGDSGDTVRALQQALRAGADGSFGPATLRAVLAWQSAQGLPEHGIADLPTLRTLGMAIS